MVKGALVGLLFALVVGIWPAHASVSGVSVTSPTNNQVIAGTYNSNGTTSGFSVSVRGSASTNCSSFSKITFKVTGPNSYSYSPSSWTFSYGSSSYSNKGPSTPWPTQDLRNGTYTTTIYATDTGGVLCSSNTGSAYTTAKLANPPAAPLWDGSPAAASDGSANVQLTFKKNAELDMVEYHILRQGPDGAKVAIVSASNPGSSGCSLSGNTYTCIDPASNFPASYDGTYTYAVNAWRSRPSFNSGETEKTCETNGSPCVGSAASDERSVTLTSPPPTPDPTTSPSPDPTHSPWGGGGITPTPGGGGSKSGTGGTKGTSVLSFGSSRGQSFNEFYSGTYDENLPYQPKSLIIGGQGTRTPDGKTIEAASLADGPPNYRTIMLPVAGGLLAFLSAAHVRRLLIHF